MIKIEGRKELVVEHDDMPTCPRCGDKLTYFEETWFCPQEGIYYDVRFTEKSFAYTQIGVFG